MKYIVDYVRIGQADHGHANRDALVQHSTVKEYGKYTWNSKTWDGGFGRQVLGETWVNHHGHHGKESTRGLFATGQEGPSRFCVASRKERSLARPTSTP